MGFGGERSLHAAGTPEIDMFSLKNRTALVAGASRGIGLAIAQQMASAGARTILAARSREALSERVRELTTDGYDASALLRYWAGR